MWVYIIHIYPHVCGYYVYMKRMYTYTQTSVDICVDMKHIYTS